MTITAPDTVFQLERDIFNTQSEMTRLGKPTTTGLQFLRDAVTDAITRYNHQTDPQRRAELDVKRQAAEMALANELDRQEKYGDLDKRLADLTSRLEVAKANERAEKAQAASDALSTALDEYRYASLACARAYRKLLTANRVASATPGAMGIAVNLDFHIPHLISPYWDGTLGQAMSQGLMPWEGQEKQNG